MYVLHRISGIYELERLWSAMMGMTYCIYGSVSGEDSVLSGNCVDDTKSSHTSR